MNRKYSDFEVENKVSKSFHINTLLHFCTSTNYPYIANMRKLTVQEEECMQLVWKNNGGFVKEILDLMPGEKIPYTTLASTLKKLEQHGFVKAVKYANAYRYEPAVQEEEYKKVFMNGFVSDYFKNSYKELVSFFAKEEKISAQELDEIVRMIKERK